MQLLPDQEKCAAWKNCWSLRLHSTGDICARARCWAFRVTPARDSRARARLFAPGAPDHWHAYLQAYQVMPTDQLLEAREVALTISLQDLISREGLRVRGRGILQKNSTRITRIGRMNTDLAFL